MNRLDHRWLIGGIVVLIMAFGALVVLGLIVLFLAGSSGNLQAATATARAVAIQATAEQRVTQAATGDSDGDGLGDGHERSLGTNPFNPDSDGDGLTDGQEVNVIGTNPLDRDSDNNGILDSTQLSGPIAPTPLPTFARALPIAIPINPGGSNVATSGSPAQAVIDYYNLVSRGSYNETWPLLTDQFKQVFNCCAPNYNYSGYVDWWNSVDVVAFGEVRTVSQQGDRAVVYAELSYHMQAGGISRDREAYIEMVYDGGVWRFNNKGSSPVFP